MSTLVVGLAASLTGSTAAGGHSGGRRRGRSIAPGRDRTCASRGLWRRLAAQARARRVAEIERVSARVNPARILPAMLTLSSSTSQLCHSSLNPEWQPFSLTKSPTLTCCHGALEVDGAAWSASTSCAACVVLPVPGVLPIHLLSALASAGERVCTADVPGDENVWPLSFCHGKLVERESGARKLRRSRFQLPSRVRQHF